MGHNNLEGINEVLEKVGHDFYTNTSFLLKDKFTDKEIGEIEGKITELFELVYTKLEENKYINPPFHEEKVGHLYVIYVKLDYQKYIIFSQYGNAIRKYTEEDIEGKKVLYYLDINTKAKTTEVKLMGTGWYY